MGKAGGGRGGEHIKELLGMGRHNWGDIHFVLAAAFVVLIGVHIVLHWNWIKCYCKHALCRRGTAEAE